MAHVDQKGRRVRSCPSCSGWEDPPSDRAAKFVIAGVRHHCPEIWLVGRRQMHEVGGLNPHEAYHRAMLDWAATCRMEEVHLDHD